MSLSEDTIIFPPLLEAELAIPIDQAIDDGCRKLKLPLLGGPSGRGWSYFGTMSQCPYLFQQTYLVAEADGREKTKPAEALQVGGMFHSLAALYYGYGLAEGKAFYHRRGLLAPDFVGKIGLRGCKGNVSGVNGKSGFLEIPNDAADKLIAHLKDAADAGIKKDIERSIAAANAPEAAPSIVPEPRPAASVIFEAARVFDAHTEHYGAGREDLEPLAVEWFAEHPTLGYTCRYDAIVRLGPNDPFARAGMIEAGAVMVIERKSSRWLSEMALEGWFIDGEILGQLLLWEPSGCARIFGPLGGLIVDVVTKEKVPKFERVLIPPNPVTVAMHERGIRWQQAEMATWAAARFYPRRLTSCWRWGRRCGLYDHCRGAATAEDRDE